jgi:hypothetical protein
MNHPELILYANRLLSYAQSISEAVAAPELYRQRQALADLAEASEISRRLYTALFVYIKEKEKAS